MIKAVLFDMDGLMFDTERLSNRILCQVAEEMGLPVSEEFLMSMKGRNKQDCRKLQVDFWGADTDFVRFRSLYDGLRSSYEKEHGIPVKKGLYMLLSYLKENHYLVGLATSTSKDKALAMLTSTKVLPSFDQIVFGNEVAKGKPHPDIYLTCARKLGISPAHCLVLEDSPPGLESGHLAGCHTIMIPDMIAPTDKIIEITDAILPSLSEVTGWLETQKHM